MNTVEIFDSMKELLSDNDRWTYYALARTIEGNICDVSSPHAFSFCLLGALLKVEKNKVRRHNARMVIDDVSAEWGWPTTAAFNDAYHTKHSDVLRFIDTCKQRVES